MKTHYILTGIFLLIFSAVFAQQNTFVQAPPPNGATSSFRAPNGTSAHTSLRAHLIITPTEMSVVPTGDTVKVMGFSLVNGVSLPPANGTLKIYMESTTDVTNLKSTNWNTAVATMTEVYDGPYTIPVGGGAAVADFTLDTPFEYDGDGLYVAYEYIATATTLGTSATYESNNAIAGGLRMISNTTAIPDSILSTTSSWRPSMRFGYPNPNSNDIEVLTIIDPEGSVSSAIQSTQSVIARVKNASNAAVSNVPVTLSVTGSNAYSNVQTIANMNPGQEVNVTFTGLSTTSNANQTLDVSVPNDDDNSNNSISLQQTISCDTIGFYNNDTASAAVGYNTGTGCLAIRYEIPNTAPVTITKVGMWLTDENAAVGNSLKGMLFNDLGEPIDSSANLVITAALLDSRMEFDLIHADSNLAGETVYFGIRQNQNAATGYFPCATQIDDYASPNRYYGLGVYGGTVTPYTTLGLFMIDAIVEPIFELDNDTSTVICSSGPVDFTATSGYSNYDFFVDGVSVSSGASNIYTYTPIDTHMVLATTSLNSCEQSDSQLIIVQYPITADDSVTICEGDEYEFNGQLLDSAGSYSAVFFTEYGCDSTVNLELSVTNLIVDESEVAICTGETYEHLGQTLNTTGTYIDTLSAGTGCDSVVILDLSVNDPENVGVNETICGTETYPFGGANLNIPGTYVDTFQTTKGCDSVVTLLLNVTTVDVGILLTGSQLTALQPGATYQWLRCNSDKEVNGATGRTHEFENSGSYKVAVTYMGCTDTSDCQFVTGLGVDNYSSDSRVKLFPNPASNDITLMGSDRIESVQIIDLSGRVILDTQFEQVSTSHVIDISSLPSGAYMVVSKSVDDGYRSQNQFVKP